MSNEPMHRIIRLKRYEQPPVGYHENFLREFHFRQRAELLKPSFSAQLLERFSSLMDTLRVPGIAYAGATAVAVVAGVAIFKLTPVPNTSPGSYAVSYGSTPVTIRKMQPVSLRVDAPSRSVHSSPLFPPSYLLQARPASHESPLSF